MADVKLKPCPFCGSEYIRLWGNEENSYWCQCTVCLASTSSSDEKEDAIEAWNRRAEA